MDFDKILTSWKADYISSIENSKAAIENVFQSTINSGYKNVFITAGIIALVGLVIAFMLKSKKISPPQKA